jgi:hypothetical protein
MKPDLYTKVVLTVIALALAVIACNQYINPREVVQAQSAFAGVQYAGGLQFFDSRTGEVWTYEKHGFATNYSWSANRLKLTKLGDPPVTLSSK